jgi:hypothetical protein
MAKRKRPKPPRERRIKRGHIIAFALGALLL